MATLADIAKKCGTSTATVSYVINGQGDRRRISPAMQEQILTAADELGYRQREKKPKNEVLTIGVFWPDRNLEHSTINVINGINNALMFENAPVELSIVPFGYNSLIKQSALWSGKKYDAAVIFAPNSADMDILAKKRTKMPTVLMNRTLEGYSAVTTDHSASGKLIAEHAITKGGEDVALISNSIPHIGLDQRNKAIYSVCGSYGIDIGKNMFYCNNNIDDAYELGVRMLRLEKLPKVIICSYDIVAFGLIRAFNEAKVAVGTDVEVLTPSVSYPQLFARATPSITVVDLKLSDIAQRAVRLAIDHATGHIPKPTQIVIPPEIIYRESSPPPSLEQIQKFIERKRRYAVRDNK